MTDNLDKLVEQNFTVRCQRKNAVDDVSIVNVSIYKRPKSDLISSQVECEHNCGPHEEYCKLNGGRFCSYIFTCV